MTTQPLPTEGRRPRARRPAAHRTSAHRTSAHRTSASRIATGRFAAILAAAAAALLAGSIAAPAVAAVEAVSCDGLSIAVEGAPGTVRSCKAGEVMLPNGEGAPVPLSVEAVVQAGEASWQAVLSIVVRGRASLRRRAVTAVLEDYDWFPETRNWGEADAVGEFETVRFEARPNGSDGYWQCVGFLRYSGHVPRSVGGYRRSLAGAYCTDQRAPVSSGQVRGVLQALRF